MSGMDIDKMFAASAIAGFQADGVAGSFASARRQRAAPVHLAKCSGDGVPVPMPKRKDEAVLYTAHYDHFGIDPDVTGDNIYNGAIDNATGCGILLELARAWSHAKPRSRPRSILFAAVTAEEQGLLGSEFLGKHSPVPPRKISLDLNYDALPPHRRPRRSGSQRRGAHHVLSCGRKRLAKSSA